VKAISRFSSFYILVVLALLASPVFAQHDGHDHGEEGHDHSHATDAGALADCGEHAEDGEYDLVGNVMNHISDANEFHVWKDVHIPLPLFLYAPEHGWTTGTTSIFHHGHSAVDRYVINHGRVNRIADASFPMGEVKVNGILHKVETITKDDGKEKEVDNYYACANDQLWLLEKPSTIDGGILGGGITSFYDFSITKNVFTMMLASLLLILIWGAVARGYKRNEGNAPSGIQSFFEPFFTFIRDEVTKPMIGPKYERFQPFIMTLFFFILFSNLLGLIPFFPGGANVTGNLAVTLVLAVLAFIVTNIHGNGHYWEHVFWMPGVPTFVKPILTVVEVLGLFIKPFSLMIRLFANISAGHIIILSLIGLIFLFGENGTNIGGATAGAFIGGLFTAFMNLIELLVAFLQAFIFAILTASYIGAAVEEHEHHDHEHAH
jgi:F-type H+-transporting ATPase subunit a